MSTGYMTVAQNLYASAIHTPSQAVANGPDIPLPLPHWQHVKFLAQQEQEALARKGARRRDGGGLVHLRDDGDGLRHLLLR